jgi:hypothetical protein
MDMRSENFAYSIKLEENSATGERFLIHMSNSSELTGTDFYDANENSSELSIYSYHKTVHIEGINEDSKLNVIDVTGRTLEIHELLPYSKNTISFNHLKNGIYLFKITHKQSQTITRLFIGD